MDPIPLNEEDRAILALEGPTVAGHTCKLIRIAAPGVSPAQLRARVAARIDGEPMLTRRLGGAAEDPAWVAIDSLDLDAHVVDAGPAPPGESGLAELVATLFAARLPRDRPLWRIDLAATADGGTALIWRLHHALADGNTTMRFARELLWDQEPAPGGAGPPVSGPRAERAGDDQRRRTDLAGFIARELGESAHRSPFDAEIGSRRAIGFASVPLGPLHDAARSLCGASVNDAVLVAAAGGIRAWLVGTGADPGLLRFRVPVSLHQPGDDAGNRDSFFTLPIHLEEPDPVARLRAVHEATAARKRGRDARRLERVEAELADHAPGLERLLERLEAGPRSFALSVSNVVGPRAPVSVAGSRVRSIHALAEIGLRHGLRIAVVSLAGELHFGLVADPAIVAEPEALAAAIEAEAEALIAAL